MHRPVLPDRRPRAGARLTARIARSALSGLLALGLGLLAASAASAHDELLASDPADGAALDRAPGAIGLTFSADVLDISPTIVVTGPDGEVPTSASVSGTSVSAPLPDGLPGGAYTVAWRVVSVDGHPIQGSFGFTVASPATADPTSEPTTSPPTPIETPGATPTTSDPTPPTTEPTETPASTADGTPVGPVVAGVVGLLAVASIGWVLARRRTTARRPQ